MRTQFALALDDFRRKLEIGAPHHGLTRDRASG